MYKRSFKDFFSNRKVLYIIFAIALISISTLTIVYAALSVTLNITGNAEVVASSWDIYLDNVKVKSGSVSGNAPSITSPTTATFSTILTTPGDFYEFTVDVVNNGSIDAMIDGVSKTPTLTTAQAKYLNYIVEYQNGESINTKQLVAKNSFVRLKVRVEFRKDITASDLPTTSETLNLAFTVNYVQSDGSGSIVTNGGIMKVATANGDINEIGTIVTIGSEQFYTIGTEGNNVKLLSMYNLYIGNECLSQTSCTPYGEEATGMQHINMLGSASTMFPYSGVIPFSSYTQKGTNYSDYSGSIVEGYVNNYKIEIEKLDVPVIEARLITKDELVNLGCIEDFCIDAAEWVYATSYWSGSAADYNDVWCVIGNGSIFSISNNIGHVFGVRPVIVISKFNF